MQKKLIKAVMRLYEVVKRRLILDFECMEWFWVKL